MTYDVRHNGIEPKTHGAGAYRDGYCKCQTCRSAHSERIKRERAKRRERLLEMFDRLPHGNLSTYSNWGCRCVPCSEAWATYCRRLAAKRKKDREQEQAA